MNRDGRGLFGSAHDLGEEGDGEVGNHNAESVGTIGSQASDDEVGLIFQNPDCFQHFPRAASLTRVKPLITLETAPAETPASVASLFASPLDQL